MIYITGDTHSEFKHRFNMDNFPEQKRMTKDDYVIICGDFGGVWDMEESKGEKYWLDWFDTRSYTLLFIDGNHENFTRLYEYPEKQWHGGRVHELRPSVLHLMRGQVYVIDGKSIFTFGGAKSHDISGGILDRSDINFNNKKKRLDRERASYRIRNESWWEQELANKEDMQEGLKNLATHDNSVDVIITHCCATSTQEIFGMGLYTPDRVTDYLEKIKSGISYKKWFFGHYHDDRVVSEKETMVYEGMILLDREW